MQGETLSEFIGSYCSPAIGIGLLITVGLLIGLLAIFVLHTLTLWASADPEAAFHRARSVTGAVSSVWNSMRTLWNGGKKVAFYWVPSYNHWAKHFIEPAVYIGLDVVSQIFVRHHYFGIIRDVDNAEAGGIPFRGHYCGAPIRRDDGTISGYEQRSEATNKYCAFSSAEIWADSLGATNSDDPANIIGNGTTLLLSTSHVRKLQGLLTDAEIAAMQADSINTADQTYEGGTMFPAMNLGPLLEAVQEITGLFAMIDTTVIDIQMHVAYTVLSEVALLLFNLIQVVARAVAAVVMTLFSGGSEVVKTLLKTGIDLLMILVIHVYIPLLFAVLDLIMCIIGFVQPGTWPKQLRCVERTCFQEGGDIGAEIFTTFSSIPAIAKQVVKVVEALVNPSTGRKYGEAAEGSTEVPDIGTDAHANAAAATCAACFSCRVPEIRALWLLVAMTYGCIKDEQRFAGRVEHKCLDGGSYYLDTCGPRTGISKYMPISQWASTYTKHRDFDTGRAQHFAGLFEQLAEDEGGAANAFGYKRIADAWFKKTIIEERAERRGPAEGDADLPRKGGPVSLSLTRGCLATAHVKRLSTY